MWLIYNIKIMNINCKAEKTWNSNEICTLKWIPFFTLNPWRELSKEGFKQSKQSKTRFLKNEANKNETTNHPKKGLIEIPVFVAFSVKTWREIWKLLIKSRICR